MFQFWNADEATTNFQLSKSKYHLNHNVCLNTMRTFFQIRLHLGLNLLPSFEYVRFLNINHNRIFLYFFLRHVMSEDPARHPETISASRAVYRTQLILYSSRACQLCGCQCYLSKFEEELNSRKSGTVISLSTHVFFLFLLQHALALCTLYMYIQQLELSISEP